MEQSNSSNNKIFFYEDFDDNLNGFNEAKNFFKNNSSPFDSTKPSPFDDDSLNENSKKLFNMKLRSTVADSKFIEQSSYNLKSRPSRDKSNPDANKSDEMFDIPFSHSSYMNKYDSDGKNFFDRSYTKRSDYDKDIHFTGNDSFDSDNNKDDLDNYDINYFVAQTKKKCNIFGENKPPNNRDSKFNPSDLVSSLRDIANKIEFNDYKNTSRTIKYEDHISYLNNKISRLNEELKLSHKQLDSAKGKMEDRINELESHVRQLSSMLKEHGKDSMDASAVTPEHDNAKEPEDVSSITFPAITVDFSELNEESKIFANKLMKYLYADINDSESSQFMPRLYKALKQMPKVVDCKQVVGYITDCIKRDSHKIHSRLSQNNLFSEEELFIDSAFGIPQSNVERQVVSELESTLQFSHNSEMDPSPENPGSPRKTANVGEDSTYTKTHIIMNRSVLWAIFKATNMNNLYNYLFEALNCDNFRVVETINHAICSKFMDFQLTPKYSSKIRHPLMWSFGSNYNSNQAYRYMKMINYNFEELPSDPTTGDNLWHMVAKGNDTLLAQKLKSFSIYTHNLNNVNKDGKSPLDVSNDFIKREFYVNLIVDLASKGSEMYKKNDYDKALEFYNDAINYQSQLITNRQPKDDPILGRDSATFNREHSGASNDRSASARDTFNGAFGPNFGDPRSAKSSVRSDNYDINMGKLYYNKARTLMHLNRWVETVEYCELCLKHIPNYYNAYDTCVRAYENLLDWESAAKTCMAMRENCGLMDERRYRYIVDQRDATFFQLLDLDKNATQADIKKAFNMMCKIWHPDKIPHNVSDDIKKRCINHFNRLFDAREKLMDPTVNSIHQMKKETNYIIPTPYLNHDKAQEDVKEPKKESSVEFDACENEESNSPEEPKDSSNSGDGKQNKPYDPKVIKSRDNLNELTMERLKFMDSINLLKGQVIFDYDTYSWGQL